MLENDPEICGTEAFITISDAARTGTPVRVYTTFGQVFDGIPELDRFSDRLPLDQRVRRNIRLHAYRVANERTARATYERLDGVPYLRLPVVHVGAAVPYSGRPRNNWHDLWAPEPAH